MSEHAKENGTRHGRRGKGELLHAWLNLLRAPNLLTAPGDPLVGLCLGAADGQVISGMSALGVSLISLLLYAAGLIGNDLADICRDRAERPNRPLVTGIITPPQARLTRFAMILIALIIAGYLGPQVLFVAIALQCAVWSYNHLLKPLKAAGPLSMGLCRALNLSIGYSASMLHVERSLPFAIIFLTWFGYIAAVTIIAARETETVEHGSRRWFPAAVLAAGGLASVAVSPARPLIMFAFILPAVVWALFQSRRLVGPSSPAQTQGAVGAWIAGLLLMQAAGTSSHVPCGIMTSAILFALFPAHRILSKRFYAT